MKKTIGIIITLVLALLVFTGCSVNVDYEVKVNKDGSGEIAYIYGFSKETLESLQVKAEDMVASMKGQAEESDYTTEYYEDDELAGFKARKHIENLEKDFSLQEAFGEEYVKDNESNKIVVKSGLLLTKVSQKGEIDLTSMDDNMKDIVKMRYTVKLPVNVSKSNATEVSKDKKELTWDLVAGEVNTIEYNAKGFNFLAKFILVLALIIIIVVAYILLVKNNIIKIGKGQKGDKKLKKEENKEISLPQQEDKDTVLKEDVEKEIEEKKIEYTDKKTKEKNENKPVKKKTVSKTTHNENKSVKKKTPKKEETKKEK